MENPTPRHFLRRGFDVRKARSRGKQLTKAQRKQVSAITYRTIKSKSDKKFKSSDFLLFSGSTGSVVRLTGIAQGDDSVDQRVGRSIQLNKLTCNFHLNVADTHNTVRIILFIWKDESNPSVSQVLTTALQTSAPYLATYSEINSKQFTVIYDRMLTVDTDDPQKVGRYTKYWKKGHSIQYSGTGDTSLAVKGDVYLLQITDSVAIVHPQLSFAYKLEYTDI